MEYAFIIEPLAFTAFESEDEQIRQCKEWGLLSDKAAKAKTYAYKGYGTNIACQIVGYVDKITAVIELEGGQRHCIHPAYLKEMQASSFARRLTSSAEETEPTAAEEPAPPPTEEEAPDAAIALPAEEETPAAEQQEDTEETAKPPGKAKKGKAAKLELPEDKVKMVATVQEFTTVPNNFSDNDDEVIIYEAVSIQEPELEIGTAWSSNSATLKKLELNVGDVITFEAKIIAKKLTKHPVPYKINNPSKLQKQ
ncbi:hypothetical protein [Paenibacillus ginsengarvi]|uniref:Uncharacterized protein n=1 Tax=Paenibacillus ginsengarvi TaxID=400777 RepID=A0A3B0CGK2_9BACL|nr:hypothetical protein [Paenibacillus ginsengarvi]RKN84310.1 hypothetical protein D7M11_15045 [Paenibacillus ginsengarvi]